MSLSDAMKKLKFDKRLTENLIKYGEITQNDLEKHLNELEDVSNNSEKMNLFEMDESQEGRQH